jgi:hypothetical protein
MTPEVVLRKFIIPPGGTFVLNTTRFKGRIAIVLLQLGTMSKKPISTLVIEDGDDETHDYWRKGRLVVTAEPTTGRGRCYMFAVDRPSVSSSNERASVIEIRRASPKARLSPRETLDMEAPRKTVWERLLEADENA